MKQVKVGVLGLGTVGAGTVNALQNNANEITRRTDAEIVVIAASARDLSRERDCDLSNIELTGNPADIVNNPDVDVVVELIGGETLAKELVLKAIANGKHVVTANKALIALHGNEVFAAAKEKGVVVAYEAAVAGGIPVIKAIREGLTANHIQRLAGIINGTTNFMLTEMLQNGRSYDDVLAEAQALGYAEADPTFDVGGIDAAHKLTIMASTAFGIPLQFERCYIEGIQGITTDDVRYADELGYKVKHLGISAITDKGVELRVHPTLVSKKHILANVDGVMNAVLVKGDRVGETVYYGAGAGAGPTASSVVADLVDVVRGLNSAPEGRVPYLAFQADHISDAEVLPADQFVSSYYLRLQVSDEPGVLAAIAQCLADEKISIETIVQKETATGGATIVLLTHVAAESAMSAACTKIQSLAAVQSDVTRLRLERFA